MSLPSARQVSVTIAKDRDLPDRSLTLAMMQWTQFVEHDLSHTPTSKMSTLHCSFFFFFFFLHWKEVFISSFVRWCDTPLPGGAVNTGTPLSCCRPDGTPLAPRHAHPLCQPITIPHDDPFYSPHRVRCMSYIRSLYAFRPDCGFGPAEQVRSPAKRITAFREIRNKCLVSLLSVIA